jgi:hypothetical protein
MTCRKTSYSKFCQPQLDDFFCISWQQQIFQAQKYFWNSYQTIAIKPFVLKQFVQLKLVSENSGQSPKSAFNLFYEQTLIPSMLQRHKTFDPRLINVVSFDLRGKEFNNKSSRRVWNSVIQQKPSVILVSQQQLPWRAMGSTLYQFPKLECFVG